MVSNEGVCGQFSKAHYHSLGWSCVPNFIQIGEAVPVGSGRLYAQTLIHRQRDWNKIIEIKSCPAAPIFQGLCGCDAILIDTISSTTNNATCTICLLEHWTGSRFIRCNAATQIFLQLIRSSLFSTNTTSQQST